ncbi:MAG: Hpt domain-containing protein [Phycisphaerales bacterium]|nr:Hpt domain-containing protein [Phycisphaerales bacterium]
MADEPNAGNGDFAEPVFSSILAECPELWEVVEQYAKALPEQVAEMESAFRTGAYDHLQRLAEKLKTSGVGHGYADVSEQADSLGRAAHDQLMDDVEQKLSELSQLAGQIQAGLQTPEDD